MSWVVVTHEEDILAESEVGLGTYLGIGNCRC